MPDQYVLLTDQPWVDGIDPLGFDDVAGRWPTWCCPPGASPLAIGVLGGWQRQSSLIAAAGRRLKRAGAGRGDGPGSTRGPRGRVLRRA